MSEFNTILAGDYEEKAKEDMSEDIVEWVESQQDPFDREISRDQVRETLYKILKQEWYMK